ncbi:MAG: TonB-dependent receptor plug domain-containing protein [Ferruginibacter sp.]
MKSIIVAILVCLEAYSSSAQSEKKFNDTSFLQPVEITAVRANAKTPVAATNLSKKDIAEKNTGQDLPFILNQTPSVVVNSDAGNAIGYTGIRIRGSDASRINVTLNGVPFNDPESQGTFFVDLPDIASSAGSIQVQRGVGTSTNGAGSFGGSINISTNEIKTKKSLELSNTAGSYHSFKNSLMFSSGIFSKHLTFDGRMSNLRSDGYIDRASTRLQSFYGSMSWLDSNSSLRLNVFTGQEKTYQAWNGIDEATLATNRHFNSAGTEQPGPPYDNETDNYAQTQYQLFFNQSINCHWKAGIAAFFIRGKGYYEQYKANQELNSYGLPDYNDGSNIITKTDLIRRLWLNNFFYGNIFSLQYQHAGRNIIISGGWNQYDGRHYGEIIKAAVQAAVPVNYRWYHMPAKKKDFSAFAKWTEQLTNHWSSFVDMQVRRVEYDIDGFRNNPLLILRNQYFFLNPKAGLIFTKGSNKFFLSYGRAEKEPNRDDYEAGANQQPKPETMQDVEIGLSTTRLKYHWAVTGYFMDYNDQLVLTGKINDVGAYTRTNISKSYRAGIELEAGIQINKWLWTEGNFAFSQNKIKNFIEYIDDYDNGGQKTNEYKNTTIAFSPAVVAALGINIIPVENTLISLNSKYVSRQYLDNTGQASRSLKEYYVQDARISYSFKEARVDELKIFVQANNVFSKKYEPNGYTFSYISGGNQATENFYYPMAPANWVTGITIKL